MGRPDHYHPFQTIFYSPTIGSGLNTTSQRTQRREKSSIKIIRERTTDPQFYGGRHSGVYRGVGVVYFCFSGVVQRVNPGPDYDPALNEGECRSGPLHTDHAETEAEAREAMYPQMSPLRGHVCHPVPQRGAPQARTPMSSRPSACPAAVPRCG